MGKKLFFYTKYVVNVHLTPVWEFVSFMTTDGPVTHFLKNLHLVARAHHSSSSLFLESIKHFRKLIFSNWLVLKSHACTIGSISGLIISTIMANVESQDHHHLPNIYHLSGMTSRMILLISSPLSDMCCGQDRTWCFMISMQLLLSHCLWPL